MENVQNDKLLCNLAFEEYVTRKKILELLRLKQDKINDTQKVQLIEEEINELREGVNHLNNLKLQCAEQRNEMTR